MSISPHAAVSENGHYSRGSAVVIAKCPVPIAPVEVIFSRTKSPQSIQIAVVICIGKQQFPSNGFA
ncbi:MAG: hypothetical protein R2788_10220 [Saprospiraceae bacterium]